MKIKSLITAGVLIGIAAVMVACGPSEPEPKPEPKSMSTTALYVHVVREQTGTTVDSGLLVQAAEYVCDMWDAGFTYREVAISMLASRVPAELGGAVIGAGTMAFCPEYEYLIGEYPQ